MRLRTPCLALAAFLLVSTAHAAYPLLLIDEDCLDNGAKAIEELAAENVCGGGDPAVCVNDQLADPGVRIPLPIPEGTIIGRDHPQGTDEALWTGQEFDEALFFVPTILQSWVDAGPTIDGALNYLIASAPGFGNNGEFLLDKIPDVTPLQAEDIYGLVGERFCAVVYDSDISINYDPLEGNLQGATLGVIAFEVLAVGPDPDGSVFPDWTIMILDPAPCQEPTVPVETSTWGGLKTRFR